MRAVLGMAMMAVGAGASGCGNCDYVVREYNEDVVIDRVGCNTGSSADTVPYPAWTDMTAVNASVTFNGTSTAQVARVAEVKAAVGADTWAVSFCGAYLDRYTDGAGSLRGEGALCVRDYSAATTTITAAAFKAADEEAKELFHRFGTTNGYAASFAVTNGDGIGSQAVQWGTGRTGDVPANWCGVYMQEMMCQVAFPQIAMQKDTLDAKITAGRTAGMPYTAQSEMNATTNREMHYIRVVEDDSCETLFDVCNRREPETSETKDGYKVPILQNKRAEAFKTGTTRKLESDAFCVMWKQGFGLAQAGTAVGGVGEQVSFESGFMVSASPLLLVVALLVVMF